MSTPGPVTRFGRYELRGRLGRGGCGEVWRAVDGRTGAEVALKRLLVTDGIRDDMRSRFRREVELIRRLNSVHVVPIHEAGEVDGELYLDMRLVTGGDLRGRLRALGRADPVWAARVTGQIAHALDAAHREGVVHRDVKPSNVLVEDVAGEDFCYLADFGIARMIDESADRLTASQDVLGTLPYMAPELFRSSRNAGPPSDVYALGCVLYELLTGGAPFPGPDERSLMHQHLEWDPAPPSQVAAVPPAFDAVLARALAKQPDRRHPGAVALATAALQAAGPDGPRTARAPRRAVSPPPAPSTTVARPVATATRRSARWRRGRGPWAVLVAVALLAGGGTTAAVVAAGDDGPPVVGSRPATLEPGPDACALLSPSGLSRFGLEPPSPSVEAVAGAPRSRCVWQPDILALPGTPLPDTRHEWRARNDPARSAGDALAGTPAARVVDVSGYAAVVGTADSGTPPLPPPSPDRSCRLTLDVAPAASVVVDYEQLPDVGKPPLGREASCELARQFAAEVVATLSSGV